MYELSIEEVSEVGGAWGSVGRWVISTVLGDLMMYTAHNLADAVGDNGGAGTGGYGGGYHSNLPPGMQ